MSAEDCGRRWSSEKRGNDCRQNSRPHVINSVATANHVWKSGRVGSQSAFEETGRQLRFSVMPASVCEGGSEGTATETAWIEYMIREKKQRRRRPFTYRLSTESGG